MKQKDNKRNQALKHKDRLRLHLARKQRIEEHMGIKGKMGAVLGVIGAGVGAVAGAGALSGVGAVLGGSGGFLAGSAIQGPERKRQLEINSKIEVTLIEKKSSQNKK